MEKTDDFDSKIDTSLLVIDKERNIIIDHQPKRVTPGENIAFFNNHPKVSTLRSLILSGIRKK